MNVKKKKSYYYKMKEEVIEKINTLKKVLSEEDWGILTEKLGIQKDIKETLSFRFSLLLGRIKYECINDTGRSSKESLSFISNLMDEFLKEQDLLEEKNNAL